MNTRFSVDLRMNAANGRTASTIEHLCIVATPKRHLRVSGQLGF